MNSFFGILGIVIGIVALALILGFLFSLGYTGIALTVGAVAYVLLIKLLLYPKYPTTAKVAGTVGFIIFLRFLVALGHPVIAGVTGVIVWAIVIVLPSFNKTPDVISEPPFDDDRFGSGCL